MAFAFDANVVGDIDQSTVHIDGTLYPVIQWVYGNPAMRKAGGMDYLGGFFIREDNAANPSLLVEQGWEPTEWTHQDNSMTLGFWKRDLRLSVINYRQRWEVQGDDGKRAAFSWNDFDSAKQLGGPTARLHALVVVEGLESEGLFVLTFRGVGARAFYAFNNNDSVLGQFQRIILAAANRASDEAARANARKPGARWPYRAFWIPVGPARDGKGEPTFIKAGNAADAKSVLVPVALGLPSKPSEVTNDTLGQHYIGNELLLQVNGYYEEAESAWTHAWDNLEPGIDPAPAKRDERLPDADTINEMGV